MSSTSPINPLQPPHTPQTSTAPPTVGSSTMTTSPRTTRSPLVANNPTGSLMNRSSAQLASMLADSFRENEQLKRELSLSKRNAEKYERMVTLVQNSPSSASPPSFPESLPPAALKRIMDFEAKWERAEQEKDEYYARIRIMQDIWGQLDHYLAQCEFRAKDAREGFNKILQDAGGQLQLLNKEQWSLHLPDIPLPNTVPFPSPTYLPTDRQPPQTSRIITSRPHHRPAPPLQPPSQGSLQHAPTMLINQSNNNNNNSGSSLPSFSLPPHPHPTGGSSRVRPRAGSMDTSSYSSGPPAKKPRDGGYRDDTRRLSRSPIVQNAPPPHHSRQPSSATIPPVALHPHQQQIRDEHSRRHRHQNDDGSPVTRGHSPRRPSSRSSSTSLDEMLLEATSTHHENQQQLPNMFTYPQPQPHTGLSHPPRSPSPHSHSPVNSRGVMFQGQSQGGSLHSYQTHIFAPPVTGAPPAKKSNTTTSMSNNLSRGSSLTGNPSHQGHHGTHVLGPGGYPPTNAQGQRICRQCGLVGRYKDGKCVEKWGPGPEGPGTVCDKCRKKMKRVERRGTIESQQQREQREQHQQVQQALAHHRSQQNLQTVGSSTGGGGNDNTVVSERNSSTSTSGSSVRRTDTVVVGPGMNYDQLISSTSSRHEDPRTSSIPSHSQSRGEMVKRVDVPPTNGNGHGSGPSPPGRRLVPTPPYIATLPGSNENDEDDERERDHERRASSLLNGSGERGGASPNGVSNSESIGADGGGGDSHIEIDRDGDDADADADCEEDAEADLLEAVDAAEEARKEKSSGGSSRGDDPEDTDEIIKMKIEEEL